MRGVPRQYEEAELGLCAHAEVQPSLELLKAKFVNPIADCRCPPVAFVEQIAARAAAPPLVHGDWLLPLELEQRKLAALTVVCGKVDVRDHFYPAFELYAAARSPPAWRRKQQREFRDPPRLALVRDAKPVFLVPPSEIVQEKEKWIDVEPIRGQYTCLQAGSHDRRPRSLGSLEMSRLAGWLKHQMAEKPLHLQRVCPQE